jgi:hypothetical protein
VGGFTTAEPAAEATLHTRRSDGATATTPHPAVAVVGPGRGGYWVAVPRDLHPLRPNNECEATTPHPAVAVVPQGGEHQPGGAEAGPAHLQARTRRGSIIIRTD